MYSSMLKKAFSRRYSFMRERNLILDNKLFTDYIIKFYTIKIGSIARSTQSQLRLSQIIIVITVIMCLCIQLKLTVTYFRHSYIYYDGNVKIFKFLKPSRQSSR